MPRPNVLYPAKGPVRFVEGKLDAGEELETALEAAAEFVKLAEERDVLIAQHRKWQREHIRTGSA